MDPDRVPPGWRERKTDTYIEVCSCGHSCLLHLQMPQFEEDGCMVEMCVEGCKCRAYVGTDRVPVTILEPIPDEEAI